MNEPSPHDQLHLIQTRLERACQLAKRDITSVRLVGASKAQSAEKIGRFVKAGLCDLGENYLQEALEKRQTLRERTIRWHFIGHIQSNKTRLVAENFSWVHGVDRLKIAERLARQNPNPQPINLLLQVNLDEEESKHGAPYLATPDLADAIAQLDGVNLRGLMVIPRPRKTTPEQHACFARAFELRERINQTYNLELDQLSMGMSNDLEAAIAEGSSMVRVGTALFGERTSARTNQPN